MRLVRSLSFGRRPNRSGGRRDAWDSDDEDSKDTKCDRRTAQAQQAQQASASHKAENNLQNVLDGSEYSYTDAPDGPCARVQKRNSRGQWDMRWLEVDDHLGVMFIYRSKRDSPCTQSLNPCHLRPCSFGMRMAAELDFKRKSPKHVYLLGDMLPAQEHRTSACPSGFEIELKTTATVGIPSRPLCYKCSSDEIMRTFVGGLRRRAAAARRGDVAAPRHIQVVLGKGSAGKWTRESKSGLATLSVQNYERHAVGVTVVSVDHPSSFHDAGVVEGDVILAIDGVCCLSHVHASGLLEQACSNGRTEIVVLTPCR